MPCGQIIGIDFSRNPQTADSVSDSEVFHLNDEHLFAVSIKSNQFSMKSGLGFLRSEPCGEIFRVHIGDGDHHLGIGDFLFIHDFRDLGNSDFIVVTDQFIGCGFIEIVIHRPAPCNNIAQSGNGVRFPAVPVGKEPHFKTRFNPSDKGRCGRILCVGIVSNHTECLIGGNIKYCILHYASFNFSSRSAASG